MRSGSVAKVTSSVVAAATTQSFLNVLSVGEETHFLSPALSFLGVLRKMVMFPFRGPWSHGSRNRAMEALATKLAI